MGGTFAEALALAGADVVVTELPDREEDAEETAERVVAAGRRAMVAPLDVREQASIQAMVDRVLDEWDQVDILVNNAGVNIRQFATDVTEEAWDTIVDTDLKGLFFCAQAVGRHMIARGGGGKIVNVASQLAVVGQEQRVVYCASKAGVVNVTRVLALEWAPHRINVNAIAPTYVRTPLIDRLLEDVAIRESIVKKIPLGRVAEPEEIAGTVVFLASSASDFITGHTVLIDGGWTAQ
jgi:2-deoxy-D-gluconate 3-dehydrogenase